MTDIEAYVNKVRESLKRNYPEFDVARVDVREITDSTGDPSLDITVILHSRPEKLDPMKDWRVMDQFRTWLITQEDDDRFPYFRLLTEDEERDLAQPGD